MAYIFQRINIATTYEIGNNLEFIDYEFMTEYDDENFNDLSDYEDNYAKDDTVRNVITTIEQLYNTDIFDDEKCDEFVSDIKEYRVMEQFFIERVCVDELMCSYNIRIQLCVYHLAKIAGFEILKEMNEEIINHKMTAFIDVSELPMELNKLILSFY